MKKPHDRRAGGATGRKAERHEGKARPQAAPPRVQARKPGPHEPETAPRLSAAEKGEEARAARPPLRYPEGPLPALSMPVILTVEPTEEYALIDSGDGEKLERYGSLTLRRPENQAIWRPRLGSKAWDGADAAFTGDTDEEGMGRWRFASGDLNETWPMTQDGLPYWGRFTSFRHVGVFPEQAAHWRFVTDVIARAGRPVRLLNLFGYTGVASLLAARAGAEVTHVDASRKAIGWARENQAHAGLDDRPIRWICEDAVRYAEREARRGSTYDVILLDPPKFGRGPKGEVWQLFEDLPYLLSLMRTLMSADPLALVLTAYSIRASFYSLAALMADHCRGLGGRIESGELVIREAGEEPRLLSTSLYSRWVAAE